MQSPITFSLRQRAPAAAATRLDRLSIVNFITGAERTEQYFGSEIPSHRIASRRRRHSVRRTRQSAAINMYKSASRDRRRIVDDSSCSLATFHSTDEVITIRDSLSDHVAASSAPAAVDRYVLHAPEPSCNVLLSIDETERRTDGTPDRYIDPAPHTVGDNVNK